MDLHHIVANIAQALCLMFVYRLMEYRFHSKERSIRALKVLIKVFLFFPTSLKGVGGGRWEVGGGIQNPATSQMSLGLKMLSGVGGDILVF